jgi:hypothetical protein
MLFQYVLQISLSQRRMDMHQKCNSDLFSFSRVRFLCVRKRGPAYLFAFVAVTLRRILISTASSNIPVSQCGFTWKPVQDLCTVSSYSPPQQNTCPVVNSLWTPLLLYPSRSCMISTVYTGPTATTVFIYIKNIYILNKSKQPPYPTSKKGID